MQILQHLKRSADDTLVLVEAALLDLEWCFKQALRTVIDWIRTSGLDLKVGKLEKMEEVKRIQQWRHSSVYCIVLY